MARELIAPPATGAGLTNHPALDALELAGLGPRSVSRIEPLRESGRSGCVYRLNFTRGTSMIAKHSWRACLEVEKRVYEDYLPRLGVPALRCFGYVPDDAPDYAWLFVEDAGRAPYRRELPEHRRAAGEWLAAVHGSSSRFGSTDGLPDRGPSHYLRCLLRASEAIHARLACDRADYEDRRVLKAALDGLGNLQAGWPQMERWCQSMPTTLVHGDFVAKNCRVRRRPPGSVSLLAFDLETAGWGVPAVDLATNALGDEGLVIDTGAYLARTSDWWPGVTESDLRHAVRVGDTLRLIAALEWASESLAYDWVVKGEIRFYLPYLEDAAALLRPASPL